jgi:hypothetical protein
MLHKNIFSSTIYRQAEGVVRAHASNKLPSSIPNYSTISRRVNNQDIKISEDIGNEVVIVLDSTGIKVANRGEWMRHKWQVRRGHLKILTVEIAAAEDNNICPRIIRKDTTLSTSDN